MNDVEEKILSCCEPIFADSWRHLEYITPLSGNLISSMCIMTLDAHDVAHVPVRSPSFDMVFNEPVSEWKENFLMRAERIIRPKFLALCREAIADGKDKTLKMTWYKVTAESAGIEASIHTLTNIKHVGRMDDKDLIHLALRDITSISKSERDITHNQYAVSLQAIFNEVVLFDVDDGHTVPIYLDGKPLKDENGEYVECGLHKLSKSVHPEDIRDFWQNLNKNNVNRRLFGPNNSSAITFDFRRQEEDGAYHWITMYLSRVARMDARRVVLMCIQNIDNKKEAQRRERELLSRAERDALTGIFNRGTVEEVITARLSAPEEDTLFAYTLFDVDNFKSVNDTYGHIMGDEILKIVAESIRKVTRNRDIAGRIGGDEFVALFEIPKALGLNSLKTRLTTCMSDLETESLKAGTSDPVTLSIGVVEINDAQTSYYDAYATADEMLYQAKKNGKNVFEVHEGPISPAKR